MDFDRLASELLRAIRGSRSQREFSLWLGYRTNVAYMWEAGRRHPTAAETLRAAEQSGVDLRHALLRFFRFTWRWSATEQASAELVAHFLDALCGPTTQVELSRRSGLSRFTVARMVSGESQPRLPDFLRLVDAASNRTLEFVGTLVDVNTLPSFRAEWRELEAIRRLAFEIPHAEAVLRALELGDYGALPRHRRGWIAARLGITLVQERRALHALSEAKTIRWKHRKWQVPRETYVDTTRRYPQAAKVLKRRWARVAAEHTEVQPGDRFAYVVFTASSEELAQLEEILLENYHRVRDAVDHMKGTERVVLSTMQLALLDHPPKSAATSG